MQNKIPGRSLGATSEESPVEWADFPDFVDSKFPRCALVTRFFRDFAISDLENGQFSYIENTWSVEK